MQSAEIAGLALAIVSKLVTLPTGKNAVFIEDCDTASAAPHWAAKPSPRPAISCKAFIRYERSIVASFHGSSERRWR